VNVRVLAATNRDFRAEGPVRLPWPTHEVCLRYIGRVARIRAVPRDHPSEPAWPQTQGPGRGYLARPHHHRFRPGGGDERRNGYPRCEAQQQSARSEQRRRTGQAKWRNQFESGPPAPVKSLSIELARRARLDSRRDLLPGSVCRRGQPLSDCDIPPRVLRRVDLRRQSVTRRTTRFHPPGRWDSPPGIDEIPMLLAQ
jgi:hypothetical protein